jgi:hypothetical protein
MSQLRAGSKAGKRAGECKRGYMVYLSVYFISSGNLMITGG